MNDYSMAYNLIYAKTISEDRLKGQSVIPKQRRQITSMMRVQAIVWIVMHTCIGKWIFAIACAGAALMNMESEYPAFTGAFVVWEARHLRD